jgi:predicted nucleotidyltransferase
MGRGTDPRLRLFTRKHLPVLRRRYRPEAFGSRVRGDALEDSDLDLLVVSKSFRDVPFLVRGARLLDDLALPYPIDVLCYTPEELARKRTELGIVSQAVEEGITL